MRHADLQQGPGIFLKNATMPGFYHGNPHQLVWQDHGYLRQSVKAGVPVSYKRTSINKKIRQPARYRVSE
jgi:hypothetical protein